LNIKDASELNVYPKLGASWEGFALEEVIRMYDAEPEETFFWATHACAEIDLLIFKQGKRLGFECKYVDVPRTTKSMHIVLSDLKLDHITVIYPGKDIFPLTEKITACGLEAITTYIQKK
jgi:predicted AAA+ superfamily ATPase